MLKQLAVLKYRDITGRDEMFSHGVAPISWDWNCSHPNILRPYFPFEKDSSVQTQHHVQSKIIRDNFNDNKAAVFTTSFNSSSIHANAIKAGEAIINVRMAIEYPDLYKNEKNWFDSKALLKV